MGTHQFTPDHDHLSLGAREPARAVTGPSKVSSLTGLAGGAELSPAFKLHMPQRPALEQAILAAYTVAAFWGAGIETISLMGELPHHRAHVRVQ